MPKDHIIGNVNEGFKPIMFNFNRERFWIVCNAVALAKVCVEDAARYALTRETFGKPLIEHQVIRFVLNVFFVLLFCKVTTHCKI